ncbi:MAG: DUF86 domain-containing protein [Roseiflexaceae bacterium]
MPSRDPLLRIQDILEAITKIQRYTQGITLEIFSADEKTVDAVIRNFIIIGEAAGQVPQDLRDRYPAVRWSDIRNMRNVLAHVYFGVSLPIVWHTISEDLDPLASILQDLLDQERSANA